MDCPGQLDRRVIRLSGDDVRGFLQGLVTQDLASVAPGAPQWAGLLTPQGKALFDFILWADGEDMLIDCEAAQAEALARRLMLYRLRRKIEIAMDDPLHVGWHLTGESPNTGPVSETAADPRLPDLGTRFLTRSQMPPAEDRWRAHRLASGVTEGVAELGSDKTLWLECNAAELNGVSFTKGCYIGQENTARMNWRAKVNRRLVVVPLDAADEKRVTARYPDLDLAVQLKRVEDIDPADAPEWMRAALNKSEEQE